MALKGQRHELDTDITFFLNEAASRGVWVGASTLGSGASMDDAAALATVPATASGSQPLGILLNDMVDIDQIRQHVNWFKDEIVKGGKVTILRKGWVVTDQISGTPAIGNKAVIANSGQIAGSNESTAVLEASGIKQIGTFLSTKDADGYAKVAVNLP